jgi:hypothetical protein
VFGSKGTSDAFLAWYGEEVGRPLADAEEWKSRVGKRLAIGLGALLAIYIVLWVLGVAR